MTATAPRTAPQDGHDGPPWATVTSQKPAGGWEGADPRYRDLLDKLGGCDPDVAEAVRAWAELLPLTTNMAIDAELARYAARTHGSITSGCGGGYILLATDQDVPNSFRIRVRR